MSNTVVTLSVGNERITFRKEDWMAIQSVVNQALRSPGKWEKSSGTHAVMGAIGFTIADKSRLVGREVIF